MQRAIAAVAMMGLLASGGASAQDSAERSVRAPGGLLDTSPQQRSSMLTIWAVLPYRYAWGIGAGARYTMPLLHDGFIPDLNDSLELEFGADVALSFWYGGIHVAVPVAARWTFHILPNLSVYPKLGLGFQWFSAASAGLYASLYPDTAVGALYRLGESSWVRVEAGYMGTNVGLGWYF